MFALPLLVLYPLYAGVMYVKQADILFPAATDRRYAMKAALPANGRLVDIAASFGRLRTVMLSPQRLGKRPAILYFHGNYECVENSFDLLQPLVSANFAVPQIEFPGFCGADGKPTYATINESASLAYDWLAAQPEVDSQRIVAMGYSMGGGAAAELSARRPVHALILLSTYTSLADIARRYAMPDFLVRFPFDPLRRVREFVGPVFVEHGRHDEVIPFEMGRTLGQTLKEGEFVPLDCGHADCHFDRALFGEKIPAWLAKYASSGIDTKTARGE